ncbi:MAG TPA: WG repeat-containing protein [Gillisia sp.]|nr:WG repeat-containing protein [Gillisia sp.]
MKLNQYEWDPVEDLIAEGAFAEVFKARDTNNENRFVALKIYKEGISKGPSSNTIGNKYTLEKEFRKIDGLSHSNVISFYGLDYITYKDGLGRTSNYPVIIMEYASEGTLLQYIQNHKNSEILDDLIIQIINGVAYLHKEGTIHRDLKPGNILISLNRRNEPVAKITDFGISRDTIEDQNLEQSVTEGVGTPHYMAPEQFFKKRFGINGEISEETDIWGLGIIFYRMLTGKRPFGHDIKDYELVREMIINDEPDISIVPEKYRELIKSCLQKKASHRPNNANDLIKKIGVPEKLEEEATVIASKSRDEEDVTQMAPSVSGSKGNKKKKRMMIPIAIFFIIGMAIAGFFFFQGDETPSQLAVVQLNQKFGYIDRNGDKAIPFRYDGAWAMSEGLGLVQTNGKWEFINDNGEVQIDMQFDDALPFSDGLAAVKIGEEWGFIDKEGQMVIKPEYDYARSFEESLAPVLVKDNWGFINQDNEFVITPQFESAYSFSEGFATVKLNSKEGFINTKGNQVIPPRYDLALSFSDGLAAVNLDGKWGFIDRTGVVVIDPIYDHTWGFSEGLAPVAVDGKWGFINKNGEMVITVKYDGASGFSNGLSAVRIKDKEGFIDKEEKTVIPFSFQYADAFSEVSK